MFEDNGFFNRYYPVKAFMFSHCKKIIIDQLDFMIRMNLYHGGIVV